ncbi:hypothetical protein ACVWY0_003597 [Arthrobacter sp. UYNi723]
MSQSADYENSIVAYFAEVLASKTGMPMVDAREAVEDCIRTELKTSGPQLRAMNLPLGEMMLGRMPPPNSQLANYVHGVLVAEKERWERNGVTDQDILAWWDLGGVMHGAYVAFDNFFNVAQVIDSMQHGQGFNSVEELAEYGQWSLAKRFALYGPANSDDGTENGRLPHELRARVESWTLRARAEAPETLLKAIESFDSFNAMCRSLIRRGVM